MPCHLVPLTVALPFMGWHRGLDGTCTVDFSPFLRLSVAIVSRSWLSLPPVSSVLSLLHYLQRSWCRQWIFISTCEHLAHLRISGNQRCFLISKQSIAECRDLSLFGF